MKLVRYLVLGFALFFSFSALADQPSSSAPTSPWFTGPLLAPTGSTFPVDQLGLEPYVFYTDSFGIYNSRWKKENTIRTETVNPEMIIFYGLGSRSDLQVNVPYLINSREGSNFNSFGDVSVILGFQAWKGVPGTWRPDLKLTIGEAFPTGRYENLRSFRDGTDSMGAGSYQTSLSATFQKLYYLAHHHFLRTRLNFTYTIPLSVNLHGLNAYGGAANTDGKIKLGDHFSTDLAFEYTLSQNWVPAIDLLYVVSSKNIFTGFPGTNLGLLAPIATTSSEEISLAPAMEYNFNANVGVIAGVWFTVTGRNASDFVSGVFAVVMSL